MSNARRADLDHRLEAWFAALRSSGLQSKLKRSLGNWQVYAAVSSSAVAMATGAATAMLAAAGPTNPEPTASVRLTKSGRRQLEGAAFPKGRWTRCGRADASPQNRA